MGWTGVLVYLTYANNEGLCEKSTIGPEAGHVLRFIGVSIAGFAFLVLLEVIEGCIAGEHDMVTTLPEIVINILTVLTFILIYIWNYYGVIQLYTAKECTEGLLSAGWITLVGNNVVWFMTVASMIGAQLCGTAVAV